MKVSLAKQNVGVKSQIQYISESTVTNKLVELGFLVGQTIEIVFTAPFGDPIAVELNGSVLSLRLEEAATIEVESLYAN
ncbi:MAG: ferrous iron transport protein A [Crocinitomicaceae bacterium]|nr:ferrous iron transport protein A [Crocinitomicaceae bacterium]NCA20527.1 ferrous iron transport protein A [Crocinitomicaceae bacterium]